MKKKEVFMELKLASVYNGRRFSTVTSSDLCKIEIDILELKYRISAQLEWYIYFSRRREEERITVMGANCVAYVDMDEINNLPLFQRKFADVDKDNEEEFANRVIEYINNNPNVFGAIIEKYQKELGSQIYNGNGIEYVVCDRKCSIDALAEEIFKNPDDDKVKEILERLIIRQ